MKEIQNAAPIKQSGMGKAFPLGATITQEGCNFAVYAPDAKAVVLCFFNSDTEEALDEFPLPEKTGDVWHGLFTGVSAGQYYGYRVERNEAGLHSVPTDKLLIDPYAKKISRAIKWDARRYKHDSQFMIPKCIVIDDSDYAISHASAPVIPKHKRVVYEAHVKGLTKLHPDVPKEHRGSLSGRRIQALLNTLKRWVSQQYNLCRCVHLCQNPSSPIRD